MQALRGVGNAALGEWHEWTGFVYHLKRRLTAKEQKPVGDAKDIRGTPEAAARRMKVLRYLPLEVRDWIE